MNGCTGPEPGSTTTPSAGSPIQRAWPTAKRWAHSGGGRGLDLVDAAVPQVAAVVDHLVVEQLLDPALDAERVARAGRRRPCSALKTPSTFVSNTRAIS